MTGQKGTTQRPTAPNQGPSRGQRRNLNKAAAYKRAMNHTAGMKSIPRTVPTKVQRYTQGGLSNLTIAPRGHGYYDAFVNAPEATILANSVGPVTPLQGIGRALVSGTGNQSFSVPDVPIRAGVDALLYSTVTTNSRLIVFNPGSSDDVVAWILKPGPGGVIERETIRSPQFTGSLGPASDGHGIRDVPYGVLSRAEPAPLVTESLHHPDVSSGTGARSGAEVGWAGNYPSMRTESIPLRGSLRIRNVTQALNVGGTVRILRYNGGLAFNMPRFQADVQGSEATSEAVQGSAPPDVDLGFYFWVCSMIRNAARTRHYGGSELCETHQVNTHPADFVRSHTFMQDTTFREALLAPKYSTTLILIDDFVDGAGGINNSYEINFNVQRAARFAIGSLLHTKAIVLRANPGFLNHHSNQEADKPSPANPVRPISHGGGASWMQGFGGGAKQIFDELQGNPWVQMAQSHFSPLAQNFVSRRLLGMAGGYALPGKRW